MRQGKTGSVCNCLTENQLAEALESLWKRGHCAKINTDEEEIRQTVK